MKRNQQVILPKGWKRQETPATIGHAIITEPGGGMVTVDFEGRCFRSGYNLNRNRENRLGGIYQGLCWRQRLEQDAIDWLKEVVA